MRFDRSLLHGMTGLLVLIVLGCASGGQHHRNLHSADGREMTVGTVQREISKGMDQAAVAQALGSPNIVSKDKEGRETWIYDKIASEVLILGGVRCSLYQHPGRTGEELCH